MDALTRIAIALESIARDLHTLVNPTEKHSEVQQTIQQMSLFDDSEDKKAKEYISEINSKNAMQPRWSMKEVNKLMFLKCFLF